MWKVLPLCLLTGLAVADGWDDTIARAAFSREGLERLYHPQYQYACIGLGGTTMRVGPWGFTRPGAPRVMPGGYLRHLPYLAYECWWDETGVRHLPFDLTGGYGEDLEPGQVTGFREVLDIHTGILTLDLDLRTDLVWEGLYRRGREAFHSRREVFVTPDGVLVVRVSDSPGGGMPFRLRVETNREVRVYLNQGIHAKEHAPWTGAAEERSDGFVVSAERSASCRATLAVAATAEGVAVDAAQMRVGAATPGATLTYFIVPGSSYASDAPAETAWEKADRARSVGFEGLRAATAAWWRAFWARSSVELPDPELARWYARSLYYHGVYFGNSHIPPGCNGTSVESFAGAVCTEYDLVFSQYALLYTNHLDEARRVTDWIGGVLPRAERYAREGLTSHQVTVTYPSGAKYGTLMGYDGTVVQPPTEGEGVNAYSDYPGANAAAMALAYADWAADGTHDAIAKRVLKETTQVSLADQVWRDDLGGYVDRHMPNAVQQCAAAFGLRECLERGVADDGWTAMAGKIVLPTAPYGGADVIVAGPGATPFEGYGDAPWLVGLWWYGNMTADVPWVSTTYDMVGQSFTWKYVFNGGWMGVYAGKLRKGDEALGWAKRMIQPGVTFFDDTCFGELVFGPEDFKKTPEIGAHGALVCNVTQMLLDADGKEVIAVFPAIPETWRKQGVGFEGLAGRGGIVVSAKIGPGGTTVRIKNRVSEALTRRVMVRLPEGTTDLRDPPEGITIEKGWAVVPEVVLPGGQEREWRFVAAR